ncbi:MAG TPA: TetR family transcriptional regulator [Sphingobium sp.]
MSVAQKAFATHGYSQTGIRDIARDVGVAPSLLIRHFGSKPQLFREALLHGIYNANYTDEVFKGPKAGFGERMAKLTMNEAEVELISIVMLATGDPDARAVTSDVAREHIINGMATWLGPPNAYARALSVIMLLHGFMLFTRQLALGEVPQHSVEWLVRTLQAIADESEDQGPGLIAPRAAEH